MSTVQDRLRAAITALRCDIQVLVAEVEAMRIPRGDLSVPHLHVAKAHLLHATDSLEEACDMVGTRPMQSIELQEEA